MARHGKKSPRNSPRRSGSGSKGRLWRPQAQPREWLDTWLWEYKQPTLRPLSFDHYETVIRRYLKPALGHIPLQGLRPDKVQRYYN